MKYKDTRTDDALIGTPDDDVFFVRRGGLDIVEGGSGYDVLRVDYTNLAGSFISTSVINIDGNGTLGGELFGLRHKHEDTSVRFGEVERVVFGGTIGALIGTGALSMPGAGFVGFVALPEAAPDRVASPATNAVCSEPDSTW